MSSAREPGLLRRMPRPRKVVLVRASRIGDFLCATPALCALRAALGEAEITLIGLPWVAELVRRSPHLDRFVPFPGYPGVAEQFFDAREATAFFSRMQAERFDLAIQMHGSGVYSGPFTLMLGARVTAGFVRAGDPPGLLDAAYPFAEREHEVRRLLALAEFLGAASRGESLEFPLWPEDETAADTLLAGQRSPLIGLHPAARDATKRWPVERFAAAGEALYRHYGGTLVLVGDAEARAWTAEVARRVQAPVVDLAGRTSLPVLGAVLTRLALLVTNDSGPAHLAYALGTPSVTIFGGTDPRQWGPLDQRIHRVIARPIACRPCDEGRCPIGFACLDAVPVAEVVAAAEEVLASQRMVMAAGAEGAVTWRARRASVEWEASER